MTNLEWTDWLLCFPFVWTFLFHRGILDVTFTLCSLLRSGEIWKFQRYKGTAALVKASNQVSCFQLQGGTLVRVLKFRTSSVSIHRKKRSTEWMGSVNTNVYDCKTFTFKTTYLLYLRQGDQNCERWNKINIRITISKSANELIPNVGTENNSITALLF